MSNPSEVMHEMVRTLGTFKFWKELVIMTIGMLVTAAAVYYFLVPSQLIIGTISGLSLVLVSIFGGKLSVYIIVINVILLILAFLIIDHEFGFKTVYTALILGPLTDFWAWALPWERIGAPNSVTGGMSVMGDPWLDLCCFVLLLSASQAILFSINASTGGLDILAKIVNKFLHFDIGTSVSVAGAVICCSAFFIPNNSVRMVIIGLIGTWINGLVVDYFTASLNRRKRVCIVSKDYERVRQYITGTLHRGCTLYEVIGGYSGEKSIELEVLLSKDDFSALLNWMKENEINAFTTANNVSEVYGLWFSNKKRKELQAEAERR